ncbi:MAG: MmcB family DNA repair protein [Alphaproteobacteria bacterium]|nr:MmcB family DNA repair protein [Alphaproteobacteria bacterium]
MRQESINTVNTTTPDITRGAMRLLMELGYAPIPEVSLTNGRRVDILGLDRRGKAVVVEVKSGPADFRADNKWQDYLEYCDEFYFAVDASFPRELLDAPESLPDIAGVIVGDAYGADILRPAAMRKVNPTRRKTLTLMAARAAALRLASVQIRLIP